MAFELQILHGSDFEAGIPALDDAVGFSTVVNALKDDYANTLILSSGDNYIPGPFLSSASDRSMRDILGREGVGRADIAILNEIGVQASAFGNHEFDLGTSAVGSLIGEDRGYPGTLFPYLSVNVDVSGDENLADFVVPDGQAPQPNSIAKSVVLTSGGEQIGVIGATTPTLPSISSPGADVVVTPQPFAGSPTAEQLDQLASIIQAEVNTLTSQGINKIVVLAHMQQLFIERELAKRLTGVDIIVAGGSHTLLADNTDAITAGDTAAPDVSYPIVETNPTTGEQVLVLNTAANYTYVGRLVATFDDNGVIDPSSLDPTINGAYATDPANVAALTATNPGTPDPEVVEITDALREIVNTKDGNLFGETSVFLEGRRNEVRTEETNLGNLTADANLFVAQQIDPSTILSLKNGGGIRDNIGAVAAAPGATDPNDVETLPPPANGAAGKEEGDISQLDIENSLRFNNGLSLVTVTASQLKAIMEHGVSATEPGSTPGQFPQIGGFSFSFDSTRTPRSDTNPGERVQSLAVLNEDGTIADVVVRDGQVVGDPNRTFRMVTLNFLADGGDGYPFADFAATSNRVDIVTAEDAPRTGNAVFAPNGSEQDALAEYLIDEYSDQPFGQNDVAPEFDTRIQNLSVRDDTVLTATVEGSGSNDTLTGSSGDDAIAGEGGNDTLFGFGGSDDLDGGRGNDQIFGGRGNDQCNGGKGNDHVRAGQGDDMLMTGGDGDDVMAGKGGADTFVLETGAGIALIRDFDAAEGDRFGLLSNLSFGDLSFTGVGPNTQIRAGNDLIALVWSLNPTDISSALFVEVSV